MYRIIIMWSILLTCTQACRPCARDYISTNDHSIFYNYNIILNTLFNSYVWYYCIRIDCEMFNMYTTYQWLLMSTTYFSPRYISRHLFLARNPTEILVKTLVETLVLNPNNNPSKNPSKIPNEIPSENLLKP